MFFLILVLWLQIFIFCEIVHLHKFAHLHKFKLKLCKHEMTQLFFAYKISNSDQYYKVVLHGKWPTWSKHNTVSQFHTGTLPGQLCFKLTVILIDHKFSFISLVNCITTVFVLSLYWKHFRATWLPSLACNSCFIITQKCGTIEISNFLCGLELSMPSVLSGQQSGTWYELLAGCQLPFSFCGFNRGNKNT